MEKLEELAKAGQPDMFGEQQRESRENNNQAFSCRFKMTLVCVKKPKRWDNKVQFYSHYIKSAHKWSQYWQLRYWETFMALMRTFQWLYLPPLLQRLSAAKRPTVEVLSRFCIILEFCQYDHISTAQTWPSNFIIRVFEGYKKKNHHLALSTGVLPKKKMKPVSLGLRCRCTSVHNIVVVVVVGQKWPRGPDHGSFTPHMDHLIWHQSNLLVSKLIPRQHLWHQQTCWRKPISKQQTAPAHRRMNNGGFVDMKISHALTLTWGQLHNVSYFGGGRGGVYFLTAKEWLIKEKYLEKYYQVM